jgi:hypothetical protein
VQAHLIICSPTSFVKFLLKYEAYMIRFFRIVFQKKPWGLSVQDFDCRRKNIGIIEIAKRNGFEIIEQESS